LKDNQAKARIRARVERAGLGNFGDWSPEGGGDKHTQKTDIKQAHKIAKEIE